MDDATKQLGAALGRIPSGLFVITARHNDTETGLLASWVQQCAFTPPHVSVAVKRDRPVTAWLTAGVAFMINVLDDSQTDMVAHFGRGFAPGEPAFEGLDVERPEDVAPILREALACLHCRVAERVAVGDHELILAQVVGGRVLNDGHPMVHVRKSGFHY